MANNPYVNKVEFGGQTIIDLTGDTVEPGVLVDGYTAHDRSGAPIGGTFVPVTGVKGDQESSYRTGDVNLTPANIGAVAAADVVNDLDSTDATEVLAAPQGKRLYELISVSQSTTTSIMQLANSVDIGTVRHFCIEYAGAVTDYPPALANISATTYVFVSIYRYTRGLMKVDITAVVGTSGAIKTIHGEIFNNALWWGNVI